MKTDKKSSSIKSTREKMLERKKKLQEKGSGSGIIFPKEGTMRVRLVSQGPDKEIGFEMVQFYSQKTGGIISPATFNEPCPFMEKFQELKGSSDPDDQELAKSLSPRRRYLVAGTIYKDEKGKEVDPDKVGKLILIPSSVYQDIIDLYLDEDDWGDMTDLDDGYDIKITRTGKGKLDTTYTVTACPKGKNPDPKFLQPVDIGEKLRSQMMSYDELEDKLNEFMYGSNTDDSDDQEEEEKPKKALKKKKKFHSDI